MRLILLSVFVLIGYNLIGNLSNDIYSPKLPLLKEEFESGEELIKFTFSVWFLGSCIGQILYAIVFSIYNKERSFLVSGILFCVATILCVDPPNLYLLTVGRFLQGLGFSACNILLFIEIQRSFNYQNKVKLFTLNSSIGALSPIIGPLTAGYITANYQWYYDYYLIFIFSFILLFIYMLLNSVKMHEVHQAENAQKLKELFQEYRNVATNIKYIITLITPGIILSSVSGYLLLSPFIFIQEFKMSIQELGNTQAMIMTSYILGMVISNKLYPKSLFSLVTIGCVLAMSSGGLIFICRFFGYDILYIYLICIMAGLIGLGYMLNPLIANAMNTATHKAVGASVIWVSSSALCSLYTTLISVINYDKLLILGVLFVFNVGIIWLANLRAS